MGDRLKYERFFWFHNLVKIKKYPNTRHIVERYEISFRTAQRDIEFMRDRLNAPLQYDTAKRGYFYDNDSYELPPLWLNEDNIIALSLAVRLASSIPDTGIKEELRGLLEKIFVLHGSDKKTNIRDISKKISVKNIEYSRVNEKYFHQITDTLFKEAPVTITYYSPHKNERTERTILPLHLMHYMGNWHIIAFCNKRKEIRDFALSRIKSINPAVESINLPKGLPSIKEYIRKNFGIMQGVKTKEVRLHFSPDIAEWMQEQIWHPSQKISFKDDGSLILRFPTADYREVKRRVLSYGSTVRVISPKEFIQEVKAEINKMKKIY